MNEFICTDWSWWWFREREREWCVWVREVLAFLIIKGIGTEGWNFGAGAPIFLSLFLSSYMFEWTDILHPECEWVSEWLTVSEPETCAIDWYRQSIVFSVLLISLRWGESYQRQQQPTHTEGLRQIPLAHNTHWL